MRIDPKRRKRAEEFIYALLTHMDDSGLNTKLAKETIPKLSDEEFRKLFKGIPIYNPNGDMVNINSNRNINICRAMGVDLDCRLWLTDTKTGVTFLTVNKHLNFRVPVRVQTQFQDKKMSVAEHSRTRDRLTAQVTGDSKASGWTFPEAGLAYADGLDSTISEFIHARGGNERLQQAFYRSIRETGRGRIDIPGAERTSAKAPRTLNAFLTAVHIGNNFGRPGNNMADEGTSLRGKTR
jgi:hypothetical protein